MDEPSTSFRVISKRKADDRPRAQSTWFFTVSYNRKEEDITPEQREWFETTMTQLWSKPYALLKLAPNCRDPTKGAMKHPAPELIEKIESEIAFETGEQRGVFHMHGRLSVIHFSKIQLRLAEIQEILRQLAEKHDPEGPGLFFRAQWTANAETARIQNYLSKHESKKFVQ